MTPYFLLPKKSIRCGMAHTLGQLRMMLQVMVLGVMVAQPAQALSNQFPQYPLITGGGTKVLPNILLILDDSGSMKSAGIPESVVEWNITSLDDKPRHRSYVHNELYYDPSQTYKPWRTDSMGDEERLSDADYRKVARSTIYLTGGTYNLAGHTESYFYIPKSNNQTDSGDYRYRNLYKKYRISPNGNTIQRCNQHWNDCAHGVRGKDWIDELPPNNYDKGLKRRRTDAEEIQNFANFYHYHRSRMKVAKAGILEAFGKLDADLRVGYNNLGRTGGIKYPIPIDKDDGQFKGINRTTFYNYVYNEGDPSGTPTREALNRAGLYFATDQPYRTRTNSPPLSCRRNYALLVTDGDWNGSANQSIHTGGWGIPSTYCPHLACIAKHYWQTDLRPDLPDEVPTSGADSANWQHMNTFSISIGLRGTLDTNNPPPSGPTGRDKSLSNKWPRPRNAATKTDDMWHAAVEGRGEFIVASDTESFANALTRSLTAINNRQASSSVISVNTAEISANTVAYGASFKSGAWSGDLVARKINAAGTGFASQPDWVLSETFKPGGVNEHFKDREIYQRMVYTSYGVINESIKFEYNSIKNHSLQWVQWRLPMYERSSANDAVSAEDNIAWLRGDQSKERQNGGHLRNRSHPIGDIVHSTVAYVEHESSTPGQNMVFAGANDGMLHAIRASDGKVIYSYIPHGVDTNELAKLSSPTYEHRFFVDGDIDIDTDYRRNPHDWHILLGSLGRGGRGVFMLSHITREISVDFDRTWPPSDTTTDPNMGYVLGQVRLRRDNRARTWAIFPNGIDSPNGKAVLFAYKLGGHSYELIADKESKAKDNGLMSINVVDINGDGYFDLVYGGDLKGNIWRWDFTGEEPGEAVKIFQAKDAKGQPQPITGGLGFAREKGVNGRYFIGFGTGRYISVSDMPQDGVTGQIQSLYGIIDKMDKPTSNSGTPQLIKRGDLQKREISYIGPGGAMRAFSKHEALPEDKKGWYIDLPDRERVISQPEQFGEAMYFISVIPPLAGSDECGNGNGSSYLNAINLFTGTGSYNTRSGYFSGYPSITLGNGEEASVGSLKLDGLRAGLALMQMPNGDIKIAIGNPNGDGGENDESGNSGGNITDGSKWSDQSTVRRIQWRSLL